MSNEAKIYWLTRLDNFNAFLIIMAILLICITAITYFVKFIEFEDDYISAKKTNKYAIIGIILFFIVAFIPSKNEAILIVAGGKTMDFVQQDTCINKIPSQTTAIITKFLDEQIHKVDSIK